MTGWIRPAPMRPFDTEERRATWLELFFDLCFVAAIAALANGLAHDATLQGLWHFAALFVPVWWSWMSFTWFATAWDNDDAIHRVGMLAAMLIVVVMAAGLPRVLEGDDHLFVAAYASLLLLLVAMFARVLPHAGEARRFARNYLLTDLLGAALWLASLLVDQPARYGVWAIAMIVLMVGPIIAVRSYAGQPFDTNHVPERYGLFTIIVLGEGVVAVAAALSEVDLNTAATTAAVLGFAIAAAIWWTYFETVTSAALSRERLGAAFLWGYGQYFAFSGIAATAVGVELAIVAAAEDHPLEAASRLALCLGPAAFLLSLAAIHRVTAPAWDRVLTARAAAVTILVIVGMFADGVAPVVLVAIVFGVLLATAVLDVRHTADTPGMQTEAAPTDEPV